MAGVMEGKVAIVTGGGSGIGRAVALAYAGAGAKTVVSDIAIDGGRETVRRIAQAGGAALFIKADSASVTDNAALVEVAVGEFGGLHVACNNAGVAGAPARLAECPPEEWGRVIGVNLTGVFYAMRAQIPAMLGSGGGSIVNVASILSQVAFREHAPYVAAKHGLLGLTRTAALEYSARGVRANAVGPAFIKTPMLETLPAEMFPALAASHPIGRMGEPEEVAELVLWLSSERASFVTGAYYPVDGGYLAQ